MTNRMHILAAAVFIAAGLHGTVVYAAPKPAATSAACTTPTTIPNGLNKYEHLAWQIFTAINCPSGNPQNPLTWETWTEQSCISGACSSGVRRPHASALAIALAVNKRSGLPQTDCTPMTTQSASNPTLNAFVPANLGSNPKFCEEVFVNQAELSFIQNGQLQTLAGQQAYASAPNGTIQFPSDALEVKADWLPADSLSTPINCTNNRPAGVYVEPINGKCYALVGIHISSKLLTDWLWATFEPQSATTNPNRCNPKLYSDCRDPWGASPPVSTGQATSLTPNVSSLMKQAGVAPEFYNYRLVGVQAGVGGQKEYLSPIHLGNSFTEFNAGVAVKQASCITCHSYARLSSQPSASTANPENTNFGAFPGRPQVGISTQPSAPAPQGGQWIQQDFSWLLGFMPCTSVNNPCVGPNGPQ